MVRAGKWAAAVVLAGASVWAGLALTAQEPKPAPPAGADAKAVDLSGLREAVTAAARRGENVDEIRRALDALEKARPVAGPGRVTPELQALRDAVDAAAKKGEDVDAVQKELAAVETAAAGRSLARPKPVPQPDPPPDRFGPLPAAPFNDGIDAEAFQKGMDLRRKALKVLDEKPRDPEAWKLFAEADQMMKRALPPVGNAVPVFPGFPAIGRVPDRARLGVRLESLTALAAEQLGIDADAGVAVTGVVPGSVAERVGLKAHDIILAFGGAPASGNIEEFIRQVNAAKAGEPLDLVVMRKGKKLDIKGVVLGDPGRPVALPPLMIPNINPVRPLVAPDVPKLVPQVAPVPEKGIDAPVDIRADAPAGTTPDLADLRDAVTAAATRGENVGAVRDALAALEKALAKDAFKPGAAPPELAALRAAVESAAKQGEYVAPIAKELALIEKALTGRAFQRPVIEEPKSELPFPRPPGGGFGGAGFGGLGGFNGAGGGFSGAGIGGPGGGISGAGAGGFGGAGFGGPGGFNGAGGGFSGAGIGGPGGGISGAGAGGFGGAGFGGPGGFNGRGVIGGKVPEGFTSALVSVRNDQFTIIARKDGGTFSLTGTIGEKGPELNRFRALGGDKRADVDSLEKVPAEHKAAVEALLKMVNR